MCFLPNPLLAGLSLASLHVDCRAGSAFPEVFKFLDL